MNKEHQAIVDDAVKNGVPRKDAEAYVSAGYKLGDGKKKAADDPYQTPPTIPPIPGTDDGKPKKKRGRK